MPAFIRDEYDDYVTRAQPVATPLPAVGEHIRLAYCNANSMVSRGPWAHLSPRTLRFAGKVVSMPERDEPDSFALWIEGDQVPMRIIRLRDVHSINGERVRYAPEPTKPQAKPAEQVYEVRGSKGNTYKVVTREGAWHCPCAGFSFRHACRHVAEVKAKLGSSNG